MAYDEATYRRQSDDRATTLPPTAPTASPHPTIAAAAVTSTPGTPASVPARTWSSRPRRSTAIDPDDPGRDRLGIHIGWEIVLLLAVAAIGYLLYRLDPASLRRPALDTLLITGTAIGLLTLGAGLTLRAGVPNLALGPIALAARPALRRERRPRPGRRGPAGARASPRSAAWSSRCSWSACTCPAGPRRSPPAWASIVYDQLRTAPVAVQGDLRPVRPGVLPVRRVRAAGRDRRRARHDHAGPADDRPDAPGRRPGPAPGRGRGAAGDRLAGGLVGVRGRRPAS